MKIRESEEEIQNLQSKLDDYDFLKHKLSVKQEELQNKKNELDLGDKVDVIKHNRNKKLNIIVNGLMRKYDGGDVDEFIEILIQKNIIAHSAFIHNLNPNKIIEELKQKIIQEVK